MQKTPFICLRTYNCHAIFFIDHILAFHQFQHITSTGMDQGIDIIIVLVLYMALDNATHMYNNYEWCGNWQAVFGRVQVLP